jgi:chemotaxis protein histidine kinase CheA
MNAEKQFEQQLKAFCREFRRALPKRIAEIEGLCAECDQAPAPPDRIRELRRALHSIAGSARTFGVAGVGEAARAAEQALNGELNERGDIPLEAVRESLRIMREHARQTTRKARVIA